MILRDCSVCKFEATEKIMNPPWALGTTKNCAEREPSVSSQLEKPRKITSLSINSLDASRSKFALTFFCISSWSFGYYLNSARFRLRYVKEIQSKKEGYCYGWGGYEWLRDTHQAGVDVEEEWERHIKVFKEELERFRRLLLSH
jgi:hypothetical protein